MSIWLAAYRRLLAQCTDALALQAIAADAHEHRHEMPEQDYAAIRAEYEAAVQRLQKGAEK